VESDLDATALAAWIPTLAWGFAALCVLSYFVGSYLFEVLAQKLDEPRWMAWVPIANLYLALRLLGWGSLFWWLLAGYAFGFLGMLLPGPLALLAGLAIAATVLVAIGVGFAYWPLLARRRDLPIWVGLLLVVPQFVAMPLELVLSELAMVVVSLAVAALGLAAFLWIVFHDGGPEAAPHPVGWALTGLGAVVAAALAWWAPTWIEESGALEPVQVALAQAAAEDEDAAELDALRGWFARLAGGVEEDAGIPAVVPAAASGVLARLGADAPAPPPVPDECPEGHREAGARPPAGRAWWCEVQTPDGWVREGPSRRWRHARAVEEEGLYRDGKRHGTWTRYWGTGGRHTQAEFRDGAQNGWMLRWDEAGRLTERIRFEDGAPAPLGG